MNNKKKILLLILLLLIVAAVWYFYPQKKIVKPEEFIQQGQTEINTGSFVMEVWDQSAEDGDSIQVFFNGKMIADSVAILKAPVEDKLGTLSPGEYWIGVKAINEGSTSPASAYIRLNDGKIKNSFSMDAWMDSAASWKLIVK